MNGRFRPGVYVQHAPLRYKLLPSSIDAPRQTPALLALLPPGVGAAVVTLLAAHL
jgi:hypothetical protein